MSVLANQSWVTSALDDADVPDSLVLAYSLRKVATSRKIAVVASGKLSSASLKALFYGFDHVTILPENWNSSLAKHDFAKLFILTMKSFESCTYLPPTMLVIKNCDNIFEQIIQNSEFWFSEDKEIPCFVVRPSVQAFNFVMDGFDMNHESIAERLRTWAKHYDGLCSISDMKYDFCPLIGNLENCWHGTNASIYNLVGIPLDADTENLGMFQRMVFNLRRSIYDEKVRPLFKTTEPKPIEISMGSTYNNKEPIAIVGMSCRYPGANNLEEFWNILINGEDATGTPPDFRWLPNQTIKHGDRFRKTNAGFLKCPVDSFDSNFFGISPLEAGFMDPQQRLLHEVVWEGLEDAALNPQCLKGLRGGVFVGSWRNDFNDILTHAGTRTTDEYRVYMGNAIGNTAGRLSFMLGLTGPCMGTDSSCSSAMLSIHTACKSLRNGESQFALACGVNLILEPFDKTWMPAATSDDGHCKTFDAKADGFGRAEGVGVLVLKRLSDAINDGDRIWALIKGTGVSQEGVSKSLGTPTVHCEAQAMKEALADAGITDPSSISYVEAHGTGTQVGDPIEIQAITEAYKSTTRKEPLLVGSVKTNVGHTESCSGITGIMKVVLAMKHGVIPKHRNFETLNPAIDLHILPAKIPLENTSWESVKGKSRIAGVNSFGITGTDAHVILEEPPLSTKALPLELKYERSLQIFKISAKTEEALDILLEKFRYYLISTDSTLQNIAHTANVGRADFNQRVTVIAESKEDAVKIIEQKTFLKGEEVPSNLSRKLCFLFTGQGSQYPGMARILYDTSPVFRMHFEYCENILKENYGINISHALWSTSLDISRTIYSQTSIFCVEYALLMLLASWGIKADYALGHSLGEFAAAVCAGILEIEDAIKLVAERSALIDQLPQGKMLVVKADQWKVDTIMKKFAGDDQTKLLDYAAINSKDQTVVAGDSEVVLAFSEFCKQSKLKYIVLQATHAFHSKHMDPMLDSFRTVCSTIKPCQKSKCGFISAVRGSLVSPFDINEDYWVEHTREKVNFLNASKKAVELGCTTFIEIGPQPVLAALTEMNNDEQLICLPTLKKNEDNWETMLNTLGKLYVRGTNINWKGLDYLYDRKKVSLPHYPFIGETYWPELRNRSSVSIHPFLGSVISNASSAKIFENELTLSTPHLDYLRDHCLGDNIIFPGAGYLETILAAGLAALENCNELLPRPTRPMKVENLTIESPLLLQISGTCRLQSVVEFNSTPGNNNTTIGDWNEMKIKLFQNVVSESKWQGHATALFCPLLNSNDREWIFDKNTFFETIQKPSEDDTVVDFYRKFAAAGLKFGPSFKLIEKIWPDKSKFTVLVRLKVPHNNWKNTYTVHPAILDAMLQGICMLYPISNWKRMFYVPIKIGKFVWLSDSDCMETYIYAYQSSPTTSDATALLVDGNGQVLAAMSSVELIETSLKAIEAVIDQQQSPVPELWEEIWRKMPSPCEQFTDMQKVGKIFDNGEFNQIKAFNKLPPDVGQIFKNLEKLAYLNYLRALYELGWKPQLHQPFSETLLFQELRILQEFRQYFSFFCTFLEAEGILRRMDAKKNDQDTVWEILQNPPSPEKILVLLNSPQFNDQLVQAFATTALLQKLGSSLTNFFKGLQSPISVLFPNEKTGRMSIGDFYKESMQVFNIAEPYKLITQVVLNHIRDSQQGKPFKIRILEVGSGTGAFSQISIDLLEAEGIQFEYTFTDISNAFFNSAEKKFETHIKSMIFKQFNIEEDPVAQGFIPEYFDVVLACNVIHATRNIVESLQNIQIVMKPSARLILFETLVENHLAAFTVGVLDSYWRFQDFELRKTQCTLAKDTWTQVLEANGLQVEGNFSLCNDKDAIIVSRNTVGKSKREACKTWLIFHHPNHPVSEQLKIKIGNIPGRCVFTVMAGEKYGIDCDNKLAILRREFYDDFVALLENLNCQQVEIEGILYCWALDNDNSDQEQLLQPYFNLTKAVLVQRSETTPRFAVITNGVVYLGDNELPGFHSSTLCGYTKTMKIENFDLNFKCLDIADGRLDAKRIQEIFYEIWKTDNEVQVAFSGNSRFVPKLMPCRISHSALKLPSGTGRFQLTIPKTKAITDLQFGTLEKFDLKNNEIELQVKVSALIFKDLLSVIKPSIQFDSSNAIGGDFAGVVVRVGSEVKKWKAGDRIFGYNNNNMALPSHIKMSQNHLIPIPDNWSFSDAATIPSVYVTAFMCLYESAKIKQDDVILIHTATGGVGLSAIAICKHIGCQIIATAGSKRKQNYLRKLGIQHIFNSRSIKFSDEILAVTNGRGVDAVINTLTSDGFKEATLRACAKNARFVELSKLNTWTPTEVKNLRDDVHYEILDLSIATEDDWTRYCTVLKTLTEKNVVKPLPFVKFDAVDICQALEYMQCAKHIGKIVCTMPEVGIDGGEIQISTPMFTHQGSYLITGGCGGIGSAVCQWMIERGAKHILLASRSPPAANVQNKISKMNIEGANVIPVQLDIGQYGECEELLQAKIPNLGLPPLRGIMHAAGLIADDLIVNMNWNKFTSVFDSKICGTINLHELTQDMNLDFFVIFSSFTSLAGNAFQCNYTAANAFEDAFTNYRHSIGLPAMTINWGLWGETGLAKGNEIPGLKPLSNLQGLMGLEYAMKMQRIQTCIPKIDSLVVLNKFFPSVSTYLDERVWKSSVSITTTASKPENFLQCYKSATDNEMKFMFVQQQLRLVIQNTLRINNADIIENDTNLQEMGMDSLLFIQLRNAISILVGDQMIINAGVVRNAETINMLTSVLIKLIEEQNDKSNADEFVEEENVPLAIKKESSILPQSHDQSVLSHTIQKPSGKPTAPPLLIASGMLGVKSQWDSIAKKIADETSRNVIAFDARCHGESPNLGELSYESMTEDIINLTQFLKIDMFSLLGHSIGGKTAMTVALKYPELLDKLVVVDVTPVEKWFDSQAVKGYYLAVHSILSNPNTSRLSLPEVKQLVINALTKLDCDILTRDFLTTYLGDGDRRVVWTGKPSLDIIIENIEELIGFPIALLDLKYNKPALFIKGENSTCVSDSLFPNTQKIFTNAKLTKIRNAGHFPHLSNTKDFMEVVLSFLSKP